MKTRKALSTVVGMVFSIIALTSTVAYVNYSMNTLGNYNQSVLVNSQQNVNIANEKFQVASATIANSKFNITVANTGNIPINFTKIWIQNTTATDWIHSYVPTNNFVTPGGILKNLGQNIPVSALPTKSYNIKLVTSRGNTYQFYVNSVNQAPVPLQLITAPGTVPTGFQTSIILTVTNNETNNAVLTNILPGTLNIASNNGITSNCGSPSPASYPIIPVGSTVMFQWVCTVSGNVGAAITYNATLQNGYLHNYVLGTVTIGEVLFAAESASSVSAQGLAPSPTADSVLLFDQNKFNIPSGTVPYGGFQMYNTQADNSTNGNGNGTTFLQIDSSHLGGASFYTNNGTAVTVNPGKWNATIRYISSPVPSTFTSSQYPDVIFHFENSLGNSMSNSANLAATGATWNANGGVNGTGAYPLSGSNQYLSASVSSGDTNIPSGSTKVNTAMWFKTSASCAGTCTLVRIGNSNSGAYYIIYISSHTLTFKFSDHNNNLSHGGQIDATCTNTVTVDNQQWHHIVAEKTGSIGCNLYVDGSTSGTTVTPGTACTGGGSPDCSTVSGNFDLGRDQAVGGNYFAGSIDDFVHWNGNWNNNLSQAQVTDLFKTSYGANAHKATFNIFETDTNGNCPTGNGGLNGNCNNVISQVANVQLPFMDGWYNSYSSPSASSTWGHYNYTVNLAQASFDSTQRLEFQIKPASQAQGLLGITMIIDNTGLADQWGQSQLQTPPLTTPFMAYYAYLANSCNGNTGGFGMPDNQVGNVYVFNAGPDISWIQQGSRAIFMSYDKSSAYGSIIYFGLGGFGWSATDSAATPVGASTLLYYSTPYTQPGLQGNQKGTLIPPGNYKMYIYLYGYDEEGHSLLSTDYIGPVKVYYTNTC